MTPLRLLSRSSFVAACATILAPVTFAEITPMEPPSFTTNSLDHVEFGNIRSRQEHRVSAKESKIVIERRVIGALPITTGGLSMGANGACAFQLKSAGFGRTTTFLVTLGVKPTDYGKRRAFRVKVNSKDAAIVSDYDPGGGATKTWAFDVVSAASTAKLEVLTEPDSVAHVWLTLARSTAYLGPLPRYLRSEQYRGVPKMGIALVSPTDRGYATNAATIKADTRILPANPFLSNQAAIFYNYCAHDAIHQRLDMHRFALAAQEANTPLRIVFQTDRGGTPVGVSDGAGGSFTDIPYRQITFDPAKKSDEGTLKSLMGDRYDPRFGDSNGGPAQTPWLTFNHPRLNQIRRVRLSLATIAWRDERERLMDDGRGRFMPGELSTGDDSRYFAKGIDEAISATKTNSESVDLSADFNPFVVTDALKDGVQLDPTNGLDQHERIWLHMNLARQQNRLFKWMQAVLPSEPIRSRQTKPYAADLVSRNIFTEPYGLPMFPLKSINSYHPGTELGYVSGARSGSRYSSGFQMLPWLLKQRERGRTALPNLDAGESGPDQLVSTLRAAYSTGARFVTVQRWETLPDAAGAFRKFSDSVAASASVDFPPSHEGEKTGISGKFQRSYSVPSEGFAVNRIVLFYPGAAVLAQIRLTLREDAVGGEEVTVFGSLHSVGSEIGGVSFNLPTMFGQIPGRSYTLTVESQDRKPFGMVIAADGKLAVRIQSDILMERMRSVAIGDRQDAADILSALEQQHKMVDHRTFAVVERKVASSLFASGKYREAYVAAIKADQLTLPATFRLPEHGGPLAPYPVSVYAEGGALYATIKYFDNKRCVVSLKSESAQSVTVVSNRTRTSVRLSPGVPAEVSMLGR